MTPLRIPRVIKIIAIIYVAYLALVMLLATPLVNFFTPKIYREQTGRELHIDKIIWLNPFALSFAVRGVTSNNPDGSRLWAAESLYANVSLASVWQRHLVLDALRLQGLYAQIDQTSAERYNFSDILDYRAAQAAKNPPAPKAEKSGELPAITIHRIELSAAHLGVRAPYLSEPLAVNVDNIAIALDAFTTAAEKSASSNPALIASARAFSGSIKTIEAKFLREQQPFATQLRDLEIKFDKLSTTAKDAEPFTISLRDGSNGTVQIKGDISLANKITRGTAQLRNIDLLPGWRYLANRLSFDTQSALLDGDINYNVNWNDALRYTISGSSANLHNVKLQSRIDADTYIHFNALHIEGIEVDSSLPRAQIAKAMLDQPTIKGWNRDKHMSLLDMLAFAGADDEEPDPPSPWQIQIDEIAANGGGLHWRASQLDNLPMQLAPLELQITNVRWPDPEALRVSFKSSFNNTAQLAITGAIVPKNVKGDLDIALTAVPLQWFNPLLKQQMQAKLVNGLLSAQTKLTLRDGKPVTVHTDGHIDQLELQQLPDHRKLVAWKQLQWHDLALDIQKQRVQLRRVDIVDPWAQFRINAGGTNNFQQLMAASNSTAKSTGKSTTSTSSTASPKATPANKSADAWKFAVDKIHFDNASIDFRDNSLSKAFHTTITQLTGDIEALNNQTNKPARIAMKGTVDGYAPVALTGTAAPFINPPAVKVALDITNLDLATLTPYSGTYAGYLIDSGRLTVQLVYTLENGRIQGTNRIVVNELRLGEQVSGPKVKDLPLRFAIYLLTDANGVMDLGVDVTGNVDDPDFSVGNIIWKAFRNLIFKTASSPFRALARLAGGSEDDQLDRIEFEPGSDRIVPAHNDKLNKLVAALQKKSALNLAITGHVSPSQDLEALRDLTLNRELMNDSKITTEDVRSQSTRWGQAVAKLFKKRYPEQDATALQPMQMNDWIRDNIELPASALQELASSRALAVKQELVAQHGLAPDRASIKPVDLGADDKPGRQVTMEVN